MINKGREGGRDKQIQIERIEKQTDTDRRGRQPDRLRNSNRQTKRYTDGGHARTRNQARLTSDVLVKERPTLAVALSTMYIVKHRDTETNRTTTVERQNQ